MNDDLHRDRSSKDLGSVNAVGKMTSGEGSSDEELWGLRVCECSVCHINIMETKVMLESCTL